MKKEQFLKDRSPLGMQRKLWLVTTFLARSMNGRITSHEKEVANKWENEQRTKDLNADLSPLSDAIGQQIWNSIEPQLEETTEKQRKDSRSRKKLSTHLLYVAMAAAAVLAFAFFFHANHLSDTHTGTQNKLAIITSPAQGNDEESRWHTLPDGTQVRLEPNSKISWNRRTFNKAYRELWMEGEVFFDVTHDAQRPFIIHHGELTTIVRGTSFTIHASKDKNTVAVRNGKVEVHHNQRLLGILEKDDYLMYDKQEQKAQITERPWTDFATWTRTSLQLDNADINELKSKLYHHFLVKVQAEKGLLDGVMFNADFHANSTLEDVLTILCNLYLIDYKLSDEGSQVILYKKQQ